MTSVAVPKVVNIKPKSFIVIGDVHGEFDFIFKRIEAINERNGPFDFVLFVGNFFGSNGLENIMPYIKKEKNIGIESYFITTDCNVDILEHNGNEICNNLYYLGKYGVQTIGNLNVAYVSGIHDFEMFLESNSKDYSIFDNNHMDILLTNASASDTVNGIELKHHSPMVCRLVNKCKPQYHFSGMNQQYFQLSPFNYAHHQKSEYFYKTTHCIGLSCVPLSKSFDLDNLRQRNKLSNKRYIYSARIVSLNELHRISGNLTNNTKDHMEVHFNHEKYFPFVRALMENPFDSNTNDTNINSRKRKLERNDDDTVSKKMKYSCKICNIKQNKNESHLIIGEGKHYMLLLVPFKDRIQKHYNHFEIVPKQHITNMLSMKDKDINDNVEIELHQWTECVSNYFRPNILLFYEINDRNKFHCVRNLISIPKYNYKNRNKLKGILDEIYETKNIQFEYVENDQIISSMVTSNGYIDVGIYLGPQSKTNKSILKTNIRYIHNITAAKTNVNYDEIANKIIHEMTLELLNRNLINKKESNVIFTIQQEKEYAHKIKQLFQKFNQF